MRTNTQTRTESVSWSQRINIGALLVGGLSAIFVSGCRAPMMNDPMGSRAQPSYLEPGPGEVSNPSLVQRAQRQTHELEEAQRELDRLRTDLLTCSEERDLALAEVEKWKLSSTDNEASRTQMQAELERAQSGWMMEKEKRASVTDMYLSEKILRHRAEADLIQLRLELIDP